MTPIGLTGKLARSPAGAFSAAKALAAGLMGAACVAAMAQSAGPPAPGSAPTAARQAANEAGPPWSTLSERQRADLQPLRNEWPRLDVAQKQKWLELAARMPGMTGDERARVRQRMDEWNSLTPTQRAQARVQFQQARQLNPGNRQEQWEAYQALTPADRAALVERARQTHQPAVAPVRRSLMGATGGAQPSQAVEARPADSSKQNIVQMPPAAPPLRAISPAVVLPQTGATTSLVNRAPQVPPHNQTGLPKVNARADFVDKATLLPKRGPQGAATVAPRNSPSTPPRPASAAR
jgi:hypothetical protein